MPCPKFFLFALFQVVLCIFARKAVSQSTLSINITTPKDTVCPGSTVLFSAFIANAVGTPLMYQWYSNGTAISGATTSTYGLTAPTDGQQITCTISTPTQSPVMSNSIAMSLIGPLGTLSTISGPDTVCLVNYSVTSNYAATAANAISYSWSVSSTPVGTGASSALISWFNVDSGNVVVRVTASGCNDASVSDSLQVYLEVQPGVPSVPVGPTAFCQGVATTSYTTSAWNAKKFIWNLEGAGTVDSNGVVTWNTDDAGESELTVEAVGCGGLIQGQRTSLDINVTAAAEIPHFIEVADTPVNEDHKLCQGGKLVLSGEAYGNTTSFNWSFSPAGIGIMTVSPTTDTATIKWDSSYSGTVTFYISANGCNGTTAADSLAETIYPLTGPVIFSPYPDSACTNILGSAASYSYSGTAANAQEYWWDVYSSSVTGDGTFQFSEPGRDTMTLVAQGICSLSAANVFVTVVGPVGGATTLDGPSVICQGTPIAQYSDSTVNAWGADTWSISPATAGTVSDSGVVAWSPSFSGVATIASAVTGCAATHQRLGGITEILTAQSKVTVTAGQVLSVSLSPMGTQFCSNEPFTFTATPSLPVTGYQWQVNGSPVSGVTGNTLVTPATSAGQLQSVLVTAQASSTETCSTDTIATASAAGAVFTQVPYLPASVSITDNFAPVTQRSGHLFITQEIFTFTATPVMGGTAPGYQWQMDGTNISGATAVTYSAPATTVKGHTIGVVMTSNNGCALPAITCQTLNMNW